jgi:hypothetical protein
VAGFRQEATFAHTAAVSHSSREASSKRSRQEECLLGNLTRFSILPGAHFKNEEARRGTRSIFGFQRTREPARSRAESFPVRAEFITNETAFPVKFYDLFVILL